MCAPWGPYTPVLGPRNPRIMHAFRQQGSVRWLAKAEIHVSHNAYTRDRDVGLPTVKAVSMFDSATHCLAAHGVSTMESHQLNNFLDSLLVVRRPATNRQVLAFDSGVLEHVESPNHNHHCEFCGTPLRDDQLTAPCPMCGASYVGPEPSEPASPQYSEPSRANRTEVLGVVWEWVESVLRSQSNGLRGSSTRNDRLEAWLSDCALEVCEASDEELWDLFDCCEDDKLTGTWESRFALLAFRRRVNGWDTGEVLSRSGDVPKAIIDQRLQTDEFWDKVLQHGTAKTDEDEQRRNDPELFATALADWSSADTDSMLRSIVAICEVPDFSGREQAKAAGMSKSQHYNNVAKLRTRLSCFGLLEFALQG